MAEDKLRVHFDRKCAVKNVAFKAIPGDTLIGRCIVRDYRGHEVIVLRHYISHLLTLTLRMPSRKAWTGSTYTLGSMKSAVNTLFHRAGFYTTYDGFVVYEDDMSIDDWIRYIGNNVVTMLDQYHPIFEGDI